MKIVEVTIWQRIDYCDSEQYSVLFNADKITPELMDKLLIVLYDKDIVKWNQHVPEGWKYTYEYTSELLEDGRTFDIKLHRPEGEVTVEKWEALFSVVDLEEL